MTDADSHAISHYADGGLHGPVNMVISDDGRLILVCTVDGQTWLLPSAEPSTEVKPSVLRPPGVERDSPPDGRRNTAGRARGTLEETVREFLR